MRGISWKSGLYEPSKKTSLIFSCPVSPHVSHSLLRSPFHSMMKIPSCLNPICPTHGREGVLEDCDAMFDFHSMLLYQDHNRFTKKYI